MRKPPEDLSACIAFTDAITEDFLRCDASSVKIAVLGEPREFSPRAYDFVQSSVHSLDLILSYDPDLQSLFPHKVRNFVVGGSYIFDNKPLKAEPKSKMISIVASKKSFLPGHQFRHAIASKFSHEGLECLGRGYKPFKAPSEPHAQFRFSIVVENVKSSTFFTEKLLHCLLYRCVPVYWGASEFPPEFDTRGILRIDNLDDLELLWRELTPEAYLELYPAIMNNQRAALKYCSNEVNILREIASHFGLIEFQDEPISRYFSDVEGLLNGTLPFQPLERRRYRKSLVYALPAAIRESPSVIRLAKSVVKVSAILRGSITRLFGHS